MDVKKEDKNIEFLDINQAMNQLLTKVAEAITSPDSEKIKILSEVQNLLVNLKQVDKTGTYKLDTETIQNVNKALSAIELPDDKSLKSIGIEPPSAEKVLRIEDNDTPIDEVEAREKFNQVINDNLDKTIKSIEDIKSIKEGEEKGLLSVPDTEDSSSKILTNILLTLLARNLKMFSEVSFPEDTDDKNISEIDINPEAKRKSSNELDKIELAALKESDNNLETGVEFGEKELSELDANLDREAKRVFGIGQFPALGNKNIEDVGIQLDNEIDKPLPGSERYDSITTLEEGIQSLDGFNEKAGFNENQIAQSDIQQKEEGVSLSPDVGVDPQLRKLYYTGPAATQSESDLEEDQAGPSAPIRLKRLELAPGELLQSDKPIGAAEIGIDEYQQGRRKPATPREWYQSWMFGRIFNGDRQDNLSDSELNLAGVNFGATGPFSGDPSVQGAASFLGDALTFFGITTADISRFVNSQRRYVNTVANSFNLTTAAARIERERPSRAGNDYARIARSYIDTTDLDDFRNSGYLNKDTGAVGLTKFNINGEEVLPEALSDHTSRGKMIEGAPGTYQLNSSNIGIRFSDSKVDQQKYFDDFRDKYTKRTFEIINGLNATGFLKVYTRRGPAFEYSQSETKIIPFQFDIDVGGESKSAEYSAIPTLGRSTPAQVYRQSGERNIELNLDYLVTGAPKGTNLYDGDRGKGRSVSTDGMDVWTEEYVYGYIIRNIKNLTLPNIIGPRYKLAPPIIQVWYGGLSGDIASSTGASSNKLDPNNVELNDVHPVFRTNWYTSRGEQRTYRSLWICKTVSVEYKEGFISSNSRNRIMVTATLSLTEIAPSVTDNEVLLWSKINHST